MKSVLLTLTLLMTANSAYARIYFDSGCTAYTIAGDEIKVSVTGRPTSPYRVDSDKLSQEENLVTWSGKEKDEDGNVFNLVLDQTNTTKFQEKNGVEDCFEYESDVSINYAIVKKVSKKISDTLQIKKGQKLAFVCYNRVTYGPVGQCN